MAAKNKKPAPGGLPLTIKNSLRGAANQHAALAQIRKTLPPALLVDLVRLAELQARPGMPLMPRPFPQALSQVLAVNRTGTDSLIVEARWAVARINAHAKKIERFIAHSRALSDLAIEANWQAASERIQEAKRELGYSLWLIQMELALDQLAFGLASQKRVSSEYQGMPAQRLVRVLIHYISERNEESVSFLRYQSRLRGLLSSLELSDGGNRFIGYILLGDVGKPSETGADLLRHLGQSSLIDLYEGLLEISINACMASREHYELLRNELLHLNVSGDPRLERIKLLANHVNIGRLPVRAVGPDEQLLGMVADGASPFKGSFSSQEALELISSPFFAYFMPVSARGNFPQNILFDRYFNLLSSLHIDDERGADNYEALYKLLFNLGGVAWTKSLRLCLDELISDNLPLVVNHLAYSFFTLTHIDPILVLDFGPAVCSAITDALDMTSDYPQAKKFYKVLAARESDVEIASPWSSVAQCLSLAASKDWDAASKSAQKLTDPRIPWLFKSKLSSNLSIKSADWLGGVQTIASAAVRHSFANVVLPYSKILDLAQWKDLEPHCALIEVPIIIFLSSDDAAGRWVSELRWSVEEFLSSHSVEKPSELFKSADKFDKEAFSFFLRYVCNGAVLDSLPFSQVVRDAQQERVAICAFLAGFDEPHKDEYQEELRDLTTLLTVEDGLRMVDQSRIYVDEQAFIRHAEKTYSEQYNRARDLVRAGMGATSVEMVKMLKRPDTGALTPEDVFTIPTDELGTLQVKLMLDLADEFLRNTKFGLNHYLSMRVRHGSFSGLMRGPLEEKKVISQRETETGPYKPVSQWDNTWDPYLGVADKVQAAIKEFSEGFDNAIQKTIDERLQIRGKGHPDGLFYISLTTVDIRFSIVWLSEVATFREFLDHCIELFWFLLRDSFKAAQEYMATEFAKSVDSLFIQYERSIAAIGSADHTNVFTKSVREAATDVRNCLDRAAEWFRKERDLKLKKYTIQQIVDIAIAGVKYIHKSFRPRVRLNLQELPVFLHGGLIVIYDVIFIALDNIYKRSGMEDDAEVEIAARLENESDLIILVENTVSPSIDRRKIQERLDKIKDEIDKDTADSGVVGEGGGTGLKRLARLVSSDPSKRLSRLEFGFKGADKFSLKVMLKYTETQDRSEE